MPVGCGFAAIIVAFVGRLNPVGIVFSGVLMSMFYIGGGLEQSRMQLPQSITGVFPGLLLFTLNREAQATLNQRQQFIQQTVPVEALYRDIVKTLAEMAVKDRDKPLLDMLTAQGLTITAGGPTAPSGPATPARIEKK